MGCCNTDVRLCRSNAPQLAPTPKGVHALQEMYGMRGTCSKQPHSKFACSAAGMQSWAM